MAHNVYASNNLLLLDPQEPTTSDHRFSNLFEPTTIMETAKSTSLSYVPSSEYLNLNVYTSFEQQPQQQQHQQQQFYKIPHQSPEPEQTMTIPSYGITPLSTTLSQDSYSSPETCSLPSSPIQYQLHSTNGDSQGMNQVGNLADYSGFDLINPFSKQVSFPIEDSCKVLNDSGCRNYRTIFKSISVHCGFGASISHAVFYKSNLLLQILSFVDIEMLVKALYAAEDYETFTQHLYSDASNLLSNQSKHRFISLMSLIHDERDKKLLYHLLCCDLDLLIRLKIDYKKFKTPTQSELSVDLNCLFPEQFPSSLFIQKQILDKPAQSTDGSVTCKFVALANLFKKGIIFRNGEVCKNGKPQKKRGQPLKVVFRNCETDFKLTVPQHISKVEKSKQWRFPDDNISDFPADPKKELETTGDIIHFPYPNLVEFVCVLPKGTYNVTFKYSNFKKTVYPIIGFLV